MADVRPSLEDLSALAIAAGREILLVQDGGYKTQGKSDGSPVTLADQRAEAIILQGLAELAPDIPVLAEEESAAGRIPELGRRFFCVDPLDGTRDFIAGETGEYTVNIALVEDGVPVQGVVFAPAKHLLYAGEPGRALKSVRDARSGREIAAPQPISVAHIERRWRVARSRRSAGPRTRAFLDALGPHEEIAASSSIKFCMAAEGDIDLYPRIGEVSEWDAAAGHAILRAAGGDLMRLDGAPVLYARAAREFIIDGFVAHGGPQAAGAALNALRISGVRL